MMRWIPVILPPRTSVLNLVAISYTDPQFKMSRIFITFSASILIDDKKLSNEFIDVGPSITSPLFFKNPRYSWPSCHETLPNDFSFPRFVVFRKRQLFVKNGKILWWRIKILKNVQIIENNKFSRKKMFPLVFNTVRGIILWLYFKIEHRLTIEEEKVVNISTKYLLYGVLLLVYFFNPQ